MSEMEFRYDEDRIITKDMILLLDKDNIHNKMTGSIQMMASIAWENGEYLDKEESLQRIMNMAVNKLESLVCKFIEVTKEYTLLEGLFFNKEKG